MSKQFSAAALLVVLASAVSAQEIGTIENSVQSVGSVFTITPSNISRIKAEDRILIAQAAPGDPTAGLPALPPADAAAAPPPATAPAAPGLPTLPTLDAAAPAAQPPALPGTTQPDLSTLPPLPGEANNAVPPALGTPALPPAVAVTPTAPPPLPASMPSTPPATAITTVDPVPAPLAYTPAPSTYVERTVTQPAPMPLVESGPVPQLEKGMTQTTVRRRTSTTVIPRLTPRGSTITMYPAPAVSREAGIIGPYGQGLAAAAPVGTPYLRSPAFAGPPIIYMPQTVTRVLLPGVTPYPANIMAPPIRYAYSSAPFTRTDIYVDLPYGTFYWPQGYAGTTPVEPQVPAYVVAPATAVLTNEASYAVQRYAPGTANPEVLNPINVSSEAPYSAAPGIAPGPSEAVAEAPAPAAMAIMPATTAPGPTTPQVVTSTGIAVPAPTPAAMETFPSSPFPTTVEEVQSVPSATPVPAPGIEVVPPAPDTMNPFVPGLPTAVATPSPEAAMEGIVVDDKTPGGLTLDPPDGWDNSVNFTDSYEQSSLIARLPTEKTFKATFNADIPEEGEYEVFMWWVASSKDFRPQNVPVTINSAAGPVNVTVDQTAKNKQWNSLGRHKFAAGTKQPIVTISTEGVAPGQTMSVSVDAVKLVRTGQ